MTGNKKGIQAKHADRLRLILGRLSVSITPEDMNLPGLDLHQIRGNRKYMGREGQWELENYLYLRR